uniref:Peptidase S1 domain-containing protein n=1 Tax=Equus caballus TaxID=9796 RepID=A0A9L0SZP5_HORSE
QLSPALHGSWAGSPLTPSPHTPPPCFLCSSIKVTLGAHNIQKQERTQQVISVKKAIPHPDYNPKNLADDIMLLKLEREAKLTAAVRTLSLPWGTGQVRPGEMCHVAG